MYYNIFSNLRGKKISLHAVIIWPYLIKWFRNKFWSKYLPLYKPWMKLIVPTSISQKKVKKCKKDRRGLILEISRGFRSLPVPWISNWLNHWTLICSLRTFWNVLKNWDKRLGSSFVTSFDGRSLSMYVR